MTEDIENVDSTVGAAVKAKDVAGDEHTLELYLSYNSEEESDAERLRRFRDYIDEEIKESEWTKLFDRPLQTDKIVSYTVVRNRDESSTS